MLNLKDLALCEFDSTLIIISMKDGNNLRYSYCFGLVLSYEPLASTFSRSVSMISPLLRMLESMNFRDGTSGRSLTKAFAAQST